MSKLEHIRDIIVAEEQPIRRFIPTRFKSVNRMLGGGFPSGRICEIYGRSSIGKTAFCLNAFPDQPIVLFDLSRKICSEYIDSLEHKDNIIITQPNDNVFENITELIKLNVVIIIDDLTYLGRISNDVLRFYWLMQRFFSLQRELVLTNSLVIVLNEIRIRPSTGASYNPHAGCFTPALRIKMHFAERVKKFNRVYLDVEDGFWGLEGNRCTILISREEMVESEREIYGCSVQPPSDSF